MNQDERMTPEEKSKHMAGLIGLFLPTVDMIADDFDLEHARQMLHEMEGNASRYDAFSILKQGGWQKHEADKLSLLAKRMRAVIELVDSTKRLRENDEYAGLRKTVDQKILKSMGL